MTELPEWTKPRHTIMHERKLIEALAIAWEALEYYGKMKGHNGEKVWTLVVPSQEAKDAMRHIEELGETE